MAASDAGRLRHRDRRRRRREGRVPLLHRLARPTRRGATSTARASTAGARRERVTPAEPAGHALLRRLARRPLAIHTVSTYRPAARDRPRAAALAQDPPRPRGQPGARRGGRARPDAGDGVLPRRHRRRRRARRLDGQAEELRPVEEVSPPHVRLRGAGGRRGRPTSGGATRPTGCSSTARSPTRATSSRASTTGARRRSKGRAWRKTIYGEVGVLADGGPDRRGPALLASTPYLDPERVASWGWSGGRLDDAQPPLPLSRPLQGRHVRGPVPDQTLYDTIYQERYMGLPQQNAEGYRKGSPIFLRRRAPGQAPPRPWLRRRQRALPGDPSGSSTG